MDFVAIDVETANQKRASICQVGIAHYRGGTLIREWSTYVDPESSFFWMNTSIHGIHAARVAGAPNFAAIAGEIEGQIADRIVVSHTHFDRSSLTQAFAACGRRLPRCTWLDSAAVAKRAWPHDAARGYRLNDVCARIGHQFRHHDALEDAKAAGHILLAACRVEGIDIQECLVLIN